MQSEQAKHEQAKQNDQQKMCQWLAQERDTQSVAGFVPGPGIERLELKFDIDLLKEALEEVSRSANFEGADKDKEYGFGAISLTRRPGVEKETAADLVGRFWLRPDERYIEEPQDELVDEFAYSEFVPAFKGTYFETVHKALVERFPIGRMRILQKGLYNCNSWHRDPEPRLHIPVISNPGSLFVVNHHCTHLPADGSVYFTDTRGYHTALNGGLYPRVHIVAALPMGDDHG